MTDPSLPVLDETAEIAVHGLLCSLAAQRSGRQEAAILRIEEQLSQACLPLASLPQEQALLAQAVHDGQADAATARTWQSLRASQAAYASFERLLQGPSQVTWPGDSEALAERIMADLPQFLPSRQAWTIPLSPLLALILIFSTASTLSLAGGREIQLFGLLLLLANCLIISGIALIGLRWMRRPFSEKAPQGLIDALLTARVRPAPAAALVCLGMLTPGLLWIGPW